LADLKGKFEGIELCGVKGIFSKVDKATEYRNGYP
jgi:hypothetical protein